MTTDPAVHRRHSRRTVALFVVAAIIVIAGLGSWSLVASRAKETENGQPAHPSKSELPPGMFAPTETQWATLTVEPVTRQVFRSEHVTEGKIAVDEDRSTPIFSPYSGRVTTLLAKPGDKVERGQPLFVVEAADMVQAQNDFITAVTVANKARSQLALAEIIEKRHRDLYKDKAVALRELEQAQAGLVAAQNDIRAADSALEAVRGRLRILGKSDEEIAAFEKTGKITAATSINAPIAGTVVQRKVGPGQYVNSGASDPVYVIGDLSTVWLVAYVRETEAPKVQVGQLINFSLLAYPGVIYRGNIKYVATTLDSNTRRLLVRATIPNESGVLKPEMYASVSIFTEEGDVAAAVPRDAVIYEGSTARVWVAHDKESIELRQITPGVADGKMVQVVEGLKPGEQVVTKGSLFIDRAAAGS
jgi:cobalt-zinc-cadmium efflux system membrane fusion protein